jgi:adenylate kinase family enzyme
MSQAPSMYNQPRSQCLAIVGTSGSGKTTLAHRLALQLGVPHIELDALNWGPNWTPVPQEVFRIATSRALAGSAWVTDGNYRAVRDIAWSRADTVVWLDYPLVVIIARVTWRTIRRAITREELWNGNRERFRQAFFGRESIIWWALSTYSRRKKEYPVLFGQPEYGHLRIVRLSSPRAAQQWLESLSTVPQVGSVRQACR